MLTMCFYAVVIIVDIYILQTWKEKRMKAKEVLL
jgi:hypothetical protein